MINSDNQNGCVSAIAVVKRLFGVVGCARAALLNAPIAETKKIHLSMANGEPAYMVFGII